MVQYQPVDGSPEHAPSIARCKTCDRWPAVRDTKGSLTVRVNQQLARLGFAMVLVLIGQYVLGMYTRPLSRATLAEAR